jgi:hypothetical protein
MINKIKKAINDPIYFIENYIVVNDEPIILHDYQINFIKWLQKVKNKHHE